MDIQLFLILSTFLHVYNENYKVRKGRRKVEKKGQILAWCNIKSKTMNIEPGNQDRGHSFYYIYAVMGKSCNCSKFTFLTFKIRIIYNQILLDIHLMVEI